MPDGLRCTWPIAALPFSVLLLLAAVALPAAANSGDDSAIIDLGQTPTVVSPPEVAISRPIVAQARDSGAEATEVSPSSIMAAPLEGRELERHSRLVGDVQSAEFLLTLPADARPEALLLAYRSSIDVLAEASEIAVFVNGAALTPFRPEATDYFATVELPAVALLPGRNAIRIEARHHHRIYCGAEASFSLWTEFDLLRSGARFSGDAPRMDGAGFRAALLAQSAEGVPLEVRYGSEIEPEAAQLAFYSVARATRVIFAPPRLLSVWNPASSDDAKARITLLRGPADRVSLVRGGDGALVLLIVTASDDVSGVAANIEDLLRPDLSRADIFVLEPSTDASLEAIGGESEVVLKGRYDSETLRFALAEDWVAPPAGRATLELHYAFAPGYTADSFVTVAINGEPVQSLPLGTGTPAAEPLEIRFDPTILRRGVNTLAFSVLSPGDPPGLPCPPDAPRLWTTISGETRIALPRAVPMRLGGMALTVLALDGGSLDVAAAGHADFARAAAFAALQPVVDSTETRLRVVSIDHLRPADIQELGATTEHVADALRRGRQASAEEAPRDRVIHWASWRRLLWTLRTAFEKLDARPVENAAPLPLWLGELSASAVLMQPQRDNPGELLMVLDPATDAGWVAQSLDRARVSGRGPDGRVAVLTNDGEWRSWFAAPEPPELLEPLDTSNAMNVLGAYATWAPEAFALSGLGTTWISAAIGLILIQLLRGRDGA